MTRALRWLVLAVAILLMAYPLAWMIAVSLRTPDGLNLRYYTDVWNSGPFTRYFVNSLVVAAIVVTGNLVFCTMAAYAFARYRIRGAKMLFFLVLSTIMLPKQVILVPLYIEMQRMGLIDSYWALTLPFLVDPFNIFLIRQYLLGIPTDCEEAARIDGAGEMFILFRIVFPMLTPVLAVVAIHTTLTNWNSFLFPFILTNSTTMRTLPVGLALLSQGAYSIDWGHLMAGAVLSALPVVLAFLIFQRRIIGGLTTGMTR
ncbi:MAG TPA: carbohydrate ABC transporter permease [Candidatus Krumholzibacteria bacterium]|nr:carbohydrate ABC transporter permease [Candidatus Krumholzibacteria bacterium]